MAREMIAIDNIVPINKRHKGKFIARIRDAQEVNMAFVWLDAAMSELDKKDGWRLVVF